MNPVPNNVPEWRANAPAGVPLARIMPAGGMQQRGQGVPAFWFARAIEVGSQETLFEPYRNSVWVQRAIKIISGPCSAVELEFYPQVTAQKGGAKRKHVYGSRGKGWRSADEEIELPIMRDFFRQPMRGFSYADFIDATIGWMKLQECFWILSDTALLPFPEVRKGVPEPIIVARPDRMRHIVENNQLIGWQFTDEGGKAWNLDPKQVIQLGYYNPYNRWRRLGEYEAAMIASEADWLAGKFGRNLMSNNGDTGPFIVAKNGVPTDAQREQILNDLRAKRQAQLRGDFRPVFMTGDITVEDPQIRSVDAAFVAQRLENRHEVALAFGVPPSMFDVKAAYSIGSASDFFALILNTCIPTSAKVCDGIDQLVEKLTGQKVESSMNWDEHPVLQAVRNERFDALDKLCNQGMPMKTASEYLNLNMPEFPGWDIGYLPINVVPAGSESSQMEADTATEDYSEPKTDAPDEVQEMLRMLRQNPETERAASNKATWQAHMRRRLPAVKKYHSKVTRLLTEYRARALKNFFATQKGITGRSLIDLLFDADAFGADLNRNLEPVARDVLDLAGKELLEEIGLADDPWTMPPAAAQRFLAGREQYIRGVGETARNQLSTALEQALADGLSTDQTADAIRGVFNNLSNYEARRIAMTEVGMAYGYARQEAMLGAGVQYKSWLSSHGPHVRPAHAAAEIEYGNNPIPVTEPFQVGGEALMYPGDSNGSPGNVINCQCIQIAVPPPETNS